MLYTPMRTVFQLQKHASLMVIVINGKTVGGEKSIQMEKAYKDLESKLSSYKKSGGFFKLVEVDNRTNKRKISLVFKDFVKHDSREKFLLIMGHGNEEHDPGKIWLRYYDMATPQNMYDLPREKKSNDNNGRYIISL